jgi:hypothetical protein
MGGPTSTVHPLATAAGADDGAPAPAADLQARLRAARRIAIPVSRALRGGENKRLLLLLDISGSMRNNCSQQPYTDMLAVMREIEEAVDGDTESITAALFGPHAATPRVPPSMGFSEAYAMCSDRYTYAHSTYFRPYGVDAVNASDAGLVIIITDGALDDKPMLANTVAASGIAKCLMVIVGNSCADISGPLKDAVLMSPVPKTLYPVVRLTRTNMPDVREAVVNAIRNNPIPEHQGKFSIVGGMMFDLTAPGAELVGAIRTLVMAGEIDAGDLSETSDVLTGTLEAMGDEARMQRLADSVKWFMALHSALLQVWPAHARVYQQAIERNPNLANARRIAAVRAQYSADAPAALANQLWSFKLETTPSDSAVIGAVNSRDLRHVFNMLSGAVVCYDPNYDGSSSVADQARDSLRLAFEQFSVILSHRSAVAVAAGIINGSVRGITDMVDRLMPVAFIDGVEQYLHQQAVATLERNFGDMTDVDPLMLTPIEMRATDTLLRFVPNPIADLSADCRLRAVRTARYGMCRAIMAGSRLGTVSIDIAADATGPVTREHVENLAMVAIMKPYATDPFPEFPSVVLAMRLQGDGRVACIYPEQPDKKVGQDVCFMPVANFENQCSEVLASMPLPVINVEADRASRMCSQLIKLIASGRKTKQLYSDMSSFCRAMRHLWIRAGGDAHPETTISTWRLGDRDLPRPTTGSLADGVTAADVSQWVRGAASEFISAPGVAAMGMLPGLRAFSYTRAATEVERAVAAANAGNAGQLVPPWVLIHNPDVRASTLASRFIMDGDAAECPGVAGCPGLDEIPSALLEESTRAMHNHHAASMGAAGMGAAAGCIDVAAGPDCLGPV